MAKEIILNYVKDPNLFDKTAKDWSEVIEKAMCKNGKGKVVEMKTKRNQLRNFYDKVLELEAKLQHDSWENILPFVKMLNSKVAYAGPESRELVTCEFEKMMTSCIAQINEPDDLKVFKLFFEAVVGFYKGRD